MFTYAILHYRNVFIYMVELIFHKTTKKKEFEKFDIQMCTYLIKSYAVQYDTSDLSNKLLLIVDYIVFDGILVTRWKIFI